MKRRKTQISVRLTKSEKAHLEHQAWLSGMAMEPFIRSLIAGCKIKERPPEYWGELIRQLSAIGNNINQIAHVANAAYEVPIPAMEETERLMREVWKIVKEV